MAVKNRTGGYRMPPEWRPHESTWISWPHNPDTWPEHLDSVEAVMAEAVRRLLRGEFVDVNVLDAAHERHVRSCIGRTDDHPFSVRYHHIPTNDAWCRDHGAIFVHALDGSGRHATVWRFNAWGDKYPPYDLDDRVASLMAEATGTPATEIDLVLEGGSIEIDEEGRVMTTASCLLNPNRNPGRTQQDLEQALETYLGATEVIWLGGEIEGDDTDGHIDNLARFVGAGTVLVASGSHPGDGLAENVEILRSHRFADGSLPTVIPLPMPEPVFAGDARLPASYCNFYIANRVVLLPTYGCAADADVKALLEKCFPDRDVVGLDCRDVVRGLGAFHCLTQQVPV